MSPFSDNLLEIDLFLDTEDAFSDIAVIVPDNKYTGYAEYGGVLVPESHVGIINIELEESAP